MGRRLKAAARARPPWPTDSSTALQCTLEVAIMTAAMFPHHASTLRRTIEHFEQTPGVLGLLLGGSIAHGFCTEGSDVDVMIVVSDDEHHERLRTGDACFFSR